MFTIPIEDVNKLSSQLNASLMVMCCGKVTESIKTMTVGDNIPVLKLHSYWIEDTLHMELSINEQKLVQRHS